MNKFTQSLTPPKMTIYTYLKSLLLPLVLAFGIATSANAQTQIKAEPVTWGDSCLVLFTLVSPDTTTVLFYKNLQGQTVTPPSGAVRFGNCTVYVPDFCLIEKLKNYA